MRIGTWNVNSIRVRLPQVLAWLEKENPDVLCLQETKITDDEFPAAALRAAGYHAVYAGQKTYNGVATLSRQPPDDVLGALPGADGDQKRLLAASVNGVRVINVYVPNGEAVGSDKFAYKMSWLGALEKFIVRELQRHPRLALLGDYNIAPEERDVHDPKRWEGRVLFSDKERAAFQRLVRHGLTDVFRRFDQPEKNFSWWDYRAGAFQRNHGLRIDHVLCSSRLAQECHGCRIDIEPRKHERPSDHAPVIAEFSVTP